MYWTGLDYTALYCSVSLVVLLFFIPSCHKYAVQPEPDNQEIDK